MDTIYSTIEGNTTDLNNSTYKIHLNSNHPVFEGHFPEFPVLPGVCMMDLINDKISENFGSSQLIQVTNAKFLNVISPKLDINFDVRLTSVKTDDLIKVDAEFFTTEKVFFKSKTIHQIV